MRIITLVVVSLSLSVLASPQSIEIVEDPAIDQDLKESTTEPAPAEETPEVLIEPAEEEEPIWAGDEPPPDWEKRDKRAAIPEEIVIYRWVGADGIEVFSDEVPPEFKAQARPIDARLSILKWRE